MKCLCCDQEMTKRGEPATPERAARAVRFFSAIGWTREKVLAERERVEFTMPGLCDMIDRGEVTL